MLNEIKANLIKLGQLEEIANHAEVDYEREPENTEYEETFDRAYKAEFDLYIKLSRQIAILAGISETTAKKMIQTKRNELISILGI